MSSRRVPEIVRAARASSDGTARVAHLCDLAAGTLPVNGVGLSLTGGRGRHSQVAATDEVSGKIEDLQHGGRRDPSRPAQPGRGSALALRRLGRHQRGRAGDWMVMVQLGVDANAAFAALRARAYRDDRTLQDVARDVIERRTRLDGPPR
jgi:hypothetical protein